MCYTEYLIIRCKSKEEPEVHKDNTSKQDKQEDKEDFSIKGLNDYLTKHPYNKPSVNPESKEVEGLHKVQKPVMLK